MTSMSRKQIKICLALAMCMILLLGSAQAMRISNNITALNTHRFSTINNSAVAKFAETLSSGYRINRTGDDAAGLAISEKMRQEIRGLQAATNETTDGVNLIQTAEGALTEVHAMLTRMKEIAVQAATDFSTHPFSGLWDYNTYVAGVQKDTAVLLGMVERYADGYQFIQLATDGSNAIIASSNPSAFMVSPAGDIFLVGAGEGQIMLFDGSGNLYGGWDVVTDGETLQAGGTSEPEKARSNLGAMQNRLEDKISPLANRIEHLTAAESRLRDVDIAGEMTERTTENILLQAASAMLAQSNAPSLPVARTLNNDGVTAYMPPQKIRSNAIVTHTPVLYLDTTPVEVSSLQTLYGNSLDHYWITEEELKQEMEDEAFDPSGFETKTVTASSMGIAGYKTHPVTDTYQIRQKGASNAARIAREGKALAKTNINYISLDHPISIAMVNATPSGKGRVIAVSYTTSNKGSQTTQYITDGSALRLVSGYWKNVSVEGTYDRSLQVQGGKVEQMRIDGGNITFTDAEIAGVIELRGESTVVNFVNCTFGNEARILTSPSVTVLENGTVIE